MPDGRASTLRLVVPVVGVPAPQGSKRHVGRGILIESSKHIKPWREAVKWAALEAMCAMRATFPLEGPIALEILFSLPRGRTVKRALPCAKPDADKLARSTLDALVDAGVMADDAQITDLIVRKRYAGSEPPGAAIRVGVAESPPEGARLRRRPAMGVKSYSGGEHGA
jgi:crossover junction endodeoxyribonuclease RusA